jgi:monoamine oxidase
VRVVFALREPLGRIAGGSGPAEDLERLGFLHTRGSPFNVWWTSYPTRAPFAVAWSGGPSAAALAGRSPDDIVDTAVRSLARHLGASPRRIASRVAGAWTHDWDYDPYARGAYSYVCVNGVGAADHLARPVEDTLFFAGEHTDPDRSGTVEGAIASGRRAARQVQKVFERD